MPWDFDANRPIYTQLTERLRLRIASGEYPPGGKLPAVRELTARERFERCVYRRQENAVRAVWSAGRKIFSAE